MSNRRSLSVALIWSLVASPVWAQFTTFIAPPNRIRDSVRAAVVADQKAVTDSVTRAQIVDMKTWVDSAAGITLPPATITPAIVVDSAAGSTLIPDSALVTGVRAPATATSLPTLAAVGLAALMAGAALRRRPRSERVRARR